MLQKLQSTQCSGHKAWSQFDSRYAFNCHTVNDALFESQFTFSFHVEISFFVIKFFSLGDSFLLNASIIDSFHQKLDAKDICPIGCSSLDATTTHHLFFTHLTTSFIAGAIFSHHFTYKLPVSGFAKSFW